jgi:hypothetical protein
MRTSPDLGVSVFVEANFTYNRAFDGGIQPTLRQRLFSLLTRRIEIYGPAMDNATRNAGDMIRHAAEQALANGGIDDGAGAPPEADGPRPRSRSRAYSRV